MKIIQWISEASREEAAWLPRRPHRLVHRRSKLLHRSIWWSNCTGASSLPRGRYKGDESMSSVLSYREHVHEGSHRQCLPPGALHHNNPIPDGYARVTVEEIVQGFEDLDIDIATPEGATRLGDVKRQFILWQKKFIKFPGEAPRQTSPPPPVVVAAVVVVVAHLHLRRAEEVEAGAAADLEKWKASCKKKIEGEPKPVFSDEQKKWAKTFLNTPSQAAKNLLDDYERELRRQALTFRRKQEEAEKQEKKALEEAEKKLERGKQVAQLGKQKADLSDMLEEGGSDLPLLVHDVFQKAVIEVSEEGTIAAVVTYSPTCPTYSPDPSRRVDFVADHQFAYFIVEQESHTVIFAGHVVDPSNGAGVAIPFPAPFQEYTTTKRNCDEATDVYGSSFPAYNPVCGAADGTRRPLASGVRRLVSFGPTWR
ncbi:hypothetical protein QYE76_001536 [Lolium multiflorum]|uniref:Uncharacterized protein n=1 Tax=Lolium multiflorum TaxID=4521 RepID=A0AAD8RNZ3_LOLMU|nr:hypothetical protein QYE76_001536 [Lolium multiflorum]